MLQSRSMINKLSLVVLAGVFGLAGVSEACQLTIRQAGFLRTDTSPYRRVSYQMEYAYKDTTTEIKTYCGQVNALLEKELQWANLGFSTFALDSLTPLQQRQWKAEAKEDKRELPLLSLHYGGDYRPWRTWKKPLGLDEIRRLVSSPTKKALPNLLLNNYCIFLLCPGSDAKQAATARSEIDKVIKKGRKPIPPEFANDPEAAGMNKEKVKYTKLEITRAKLATELPIVDFISGMREIDAKDSWVGVIYGKGKMFDQVLSGSKLTAANLQGMLSVLEQNCTCGTDPNRFTTDLLMCWDAKFDQAARKKILPDLEDLPWDIEAELDEEGKVAEKGNDVPDAAETAEATPGTTRIETDASGRPAGSAGAGTVTVPPSTQGIPVADETQKSIYLTAGGVALALLLAGIAMIAFAKRSA